MNKNRKILVLLSVSLLVGIAVIVVFRTGRTSSPQPAGLSERSSRDIVSTTSMSDSVNTTYYNTGERKSSGPTKAGVPHGEWTAWWPNGKIAWRGRMVNGKKHGVFIFYNRNGQNPEKFVFENGTKVQGP